MEHDESDSARRILISPMFSSSVMPMKTLQPTNPASYSIPQSSDMSTFDREERDVLCISNQTKMNKIRYHWILNCEAINDKIIALSWWVAVCVCVDIV